MKRLIKEISDCQVELPLSVQNSIFLRYDKTRSDFMRALIFGSSETPYAHGAFVFDIYFGPDYPKISPFVSLVTTGGGKVRFNPSKQKTFHIYFYI
jgi:ubiquitin-protein ligase